MGGVADARAGNSERLAITSSIVALSHRFDEARLAVDGTIVVRSEAPGYRAVARFAGEASRLVGAYVQVITDDVPGALVPTSAL